jgi:hypothetical protein
LAEECALELVSLFGAYQEGLARGDSITMDDLETAFREAALRCGSNALSKLLSDMPEETPVCPNCVGAMKNLDRREKQIVTLLGECKYSRNCYSCECGEHCIPKDDVLGVGGTSFA